MFTLLVGAAVYGDNCASSDGEVQAYGMALLVPREKNEREMRENSNLDHGAASKAVVFVDRSTGHVEEEVAFDV